MKRIFGYVFLMGLAACGGDESTSANDNDAPSSIVAGDGSLQSAEDEKNTTEIEYTEVKHDFGNVEYPSENLYTFKFKNTGDVPLVIESAKASCGCTVPNKPEEPIMPGEMGELDVIFRPKEGQRGQQVTKKVTVVANTSPAETYLEITANVINDMVAQ